MYDFIMSMFGLSCYFMSGLPNQKVTMFMKHPES